MNSRSPIISTNANSLSLPAESLGLTAYLAPDGFLGPLMKELGPGAVTYDDRLVFAPGAARPVYWAQNIWHDVERITIDSIKDGARQLRARQRNWALWPIAHFRRADLIQENLPHVGAKPIAFPDPVPTAPLGSWTLYGPDLILAARHCSSAFRHGAVTFVENRETPPNRAYLKLWEAFTVIGRYPQPGERCLDLGASPGGWTWVAQSLGASVLSIDKAPLDPRIAGLAGVTCREESAFALDPTDVGPVDWLLSDVICYPERLFELIATWRASGLARNYICTVKCQGEQDPAIFAAFAAIPGASLRHLYHNKHELTFILLDAATA